MMIEAGGEEIPEDVMYDAIMFGFEECKKIADFQEKVMEQYGKQKAELILHEINADIEKEVKDFAFDMIKEAMYITDKDLRNKAVDEVKEKVNEEFSEKYPDNLADIGEVIYKMQKQVVRNMILNEKRRPDGRSFDEIRPLSAETSLLPRSEEHTSQLQSRQYLVCRL